MEIYWILLVVFHVTVYRCTGEFCTAKIESEKDFVAFGESAVLNCFSNCTDVVWESRLTKQFMNLTTVQVLVNNWADSPVKCIVESTDGKEYRVETRVIPYVLPSGLNINLKEELEEDVEHEVTCSAYDVAPVQYAILSLTRGGQLFLNRTYEEDKTQGPHNLTTTFKFTARHDDNLQDFACQLTLNLTRVTSTLVQSSSSVTVRTYTLPENPHITAEEWLEKGTSTDIICEVLHGFPTENITMELYVDGFPDTLSRGNVLVSSRLNTSDLPQGQHNVICVSQVFTLSKRSNKTIYIYESPNVNLTVSSNTVILGDTVAIDCSLIEGNPEYFSLSISVDGTLMKKANSPQLTGNVTITRRKPNLSITCETFIQENNKMLLTTEKILTVHYPPEFNDSSCPSSIVWVEGEERMFGCMSEGNPTPEVQCSFNDFLLKSSTLFTVDRKMSGVYSCQASNYVATISKSVDVTVQYSIDLWKILLGVGLGLFAVFTIVFVVRYLLQNGKKGFYDLLGRKLGNPRGAEVPLQDNSSV